VGHGLTSTNSPAPPWVRRRTRGLLPQAFRVAETAVDRRQKG
jgi:hypothetical protein